MSGKNKNKNYLIVVFYQPCPEDKEKLKWIRKLDTIQSTVTTTLNKTIIIAQSTNLDYNKLSTVFEKYKEVIDIQLKIKFNKTNPLRCQNHRS